METIFSAGLLLHFIFHGDLINDDLNGLEPDLLFRVIAIPDTDKIFPVLIKKLTGSWLARKELSPYLHGKDISRVRCALVNDSGL